MQSTKKIKKDRFWNNYLVIFSQQEQGGVFKHHVGEVKGCSDQRIGTKRRGEGGGCSGADIIREVKG
jgi:hypothetical protein